MPEQGAPEEGRSHEGLSEQSLAEWRGFAETLRPDASPQETQLALNEFLIGVHRRGENLYAHELKTLLDRADVDDQTAQHVISFAGPALILLADYDVALRAAEEEDEEDDDGRYYDGDDEFGVEPNVLIL